MPTPNAPHESRDWITRDEAAEYLRVTSRTIDKLIARGQIKGYRFGTRAIRLDRADLDALLRPISPEGAHHA